MSYGGCTANTCKACIDQTNLNNFESCYWDSSRGCYNWYDDPNSGGTQQCSTTLSVGAIIGIVFGGFCCLFICCATAMFVVAQNSRRRRNNGLLNNNYNNYNAGAYHHNNAGPVFQPNVIVADADAPNMDPIFPIDPIDSAQSQDIFNPMGNGDMMHGGGMIHEGGMPMGNTFDHDEF